MSYVNTYRGEKIHIDEMTHQHVSNWIYYSTYVVPELDVQLYFEAVLDIRFNSELLPYKPHSEYTYEIKVLKDMGYLCENGDIIVTNADGESIKIGEVDLNNNT